MADFPLTVHDSYGDEIAFDVWPDGTVLISLSSCGPFLLQDSAARDEFARGYIAVSHEAERLEREALEAAT